MRQTLDIFEGIAIAAGRAIMEVLKSGPDVETKPDHSPVTEADTKAEQIILDGLAAAMPGIPVIAEEAVAAGIVPDIEARDFILVDPLDGTREFVNGSSEFTVNIALIRNGVPVAGVVYAPALGFAYSGAELEAEKLDIGPGYDITARHAIHTRDCPQAPITVASRSHGTAENDAFLVKHALDACTSVGSSLKFGLLAEGRADLYPRFGRTMQWDTAAGDAVLRAAGGITVGPDGEPLTYGHTAHSAEDRFANPFFIACGKQREHDVVLSCPLFRK